MRAATITVAALALTTFLNRNLAAQQVPNSKPVTEKVASFAGSWQTTFGVLELVQKGDQVTGELSRWEVGGEGDWQLTGVSLCRGQRER